MTDASLSVCIQIVPRKAAKAAGLNRYCTGTPCGKGHYGYRMTATGHCQLCNRDRHHARHADPEYRTSRSRAALSYNARPDVKRAKQEHYKSGDNKAKLRAYQQTDRYKQRRKEYARSEAGLDAMRRRNRAYRATPQGAMRMIARSLVTRCLNERGVEKVARTSEILGYSPQALVAHIERLFVRGMSWANREKWHIDHIRPLSSFDLSDPEQLRAANSLNNLRPLWAKINIKKSNSWDGQFTLPM